MSILFYKKPEYVQKEKDLSQSSCQKYVERAACSAAVIPPELSFDNIVDGKSLPPCTLYDFLDYLVYVSHDAENLQFFLWLRDYTVRFEALPATEKKLSRPWLEPTPFQNAIRTRPRDSPAVSPTTTVATRGSMKPLPREPEIPGFPRPPSPVSPSLFHFSAFDGDTLALERMRTASSVATLRPVSPPPLPSPEALAKQPFRKEIDKIIAHYLISGAPRELNLSGRDRKQALQGLAHTTHPSALESVGRMCEQALRHHSHRNFVRWSICNGNKPRVFVLRSIATMVIVLVIATCTFLVLSPYLRWYRLTIAPALYFGAVNLIAARQGLCVLLHRRHTREQRPWEIDEEAVRRENTGKKAATGSEATPWENHDAADDGEDGQGSIRQQLSKRWRERLAALGPSNDYKHEKWVDAWKRRGRWQSIRIQKVRIAGSGGLRMIQDRVVWQAELWGLLVTVVIMAAVCSFPQFALWS